MKKTVLLISSLMILSCGGGSGGGGSDDTPTSPSTSYTVSFTATAPTASNNYVKMEQSSTSGDTLTIAVKAVSITEGVGGLAVDMTYDSSKLSFVSATNGDAISGNTASFAATNSGGTIIISASDVTDASPSSSGTLFTVTLKGTASGSGSIGLSNGSLFNASGEKISGISWYGGTVTVK